MDLIGAQNDAVNSQKRRVCVVAGAGTGKTTVLVEKFVDLVTGDKRVGIDEVLAITFTEKAAVEMKRKLLQRLEEMGLEDLKREAEAAYIGTIHGFCTRILRENPVEAAVDPAFDVMDEVPAAAYMERALDSFFQDPSAYFQELLQLYPEDRVAWAIVSAIAQYRSMGYSMHDFMRIPESINRLERIIAEKNRRLAQLAADMKGLAEPLKGWSTVKSLEDKRRDVVALTDRLDGPAPDVQLIKEIRERCLRAKGRVPQGADPEEHRLIAETLEEIREMCDRNKPFLDAEDDLEREADRHRQWLHRAAHEVLRLYQGFKEERQSLDFEDLQLKTKAMFDSHPHLLKRYRDRFKAVLVDEYQDVNRLQAHLIETLSRDSRLFVVGDPKQLIYEFRDADLRQFLRFHQQVKEDERGAVHVLDRSFRSRQEILDFINPFFGKLWESTDLEYHPLHRAREGCRPKGIPSVELIARPMPEGEKMDEAREIEARAVASRVKEIVELSPAQLVRWGLEEPYSYGDIAVLFRSSSAIKAYEDAFRALDMPYSVSKGTGFFQSREFADALSLLQAVDNQQQDIPMAAILRSPLVGIDDDTLFRLRRGGDEGGNGAHLSEALHALHEIEGLEPGEREKLRSFAELLSRLRAARGRWAPDELLETALRETAYEARITSHPRGLQKLANMRKVLQFLREHRSIASEGLSVMCRFMEAAMRADISEKEAPLEPEGGNAVSFITIHGAKGLEFPVVVLADMGREYRSGGGGKGIYVSEDYGICCKYRDLQGQEVETLGYHLSRDRDGQRRLAEEQRLLYVAMTRARDHLILAGSGNFSREVPLQSAASPMQTVLAALGITTENKAEAIPPATGPEMVKYHGARIAFTVLYGAADDQEPDTPPPLSDQFRSEIASGLRITDIQADEKMLDSLCRRLDHLDAPPPGKPLSISITGLLEYRQCPARYYLKYKLGLPEEEAFLPLSEGRAGGREFGSRVHSMLNMVDLEKPLTSQMQQLFRMADLQSRYHGEAEKMLRSFTEGRLFAELRASESLYREFPFSVKLGEATLSGTTDALFRRGDGSWALLDYKTDDISPGEAAVRAEGYFMQLALYSLGIRRVLGFIPQTVMLYFLRPNRVLEKELSESDLKSAREGALRLIGRIGEEDFPLVKSPRCDTCAYGDSFCRILEGEGVASEAAV